MLWEILKYSSWGLGVLAAGLGGFLAGYLKKKGENLATHEDIDKVLEEVRATTRAAKEIEATISNDVWDRQKRWELKREILFDASKKTGNLGHALGALYGVYIPQENEMNKETIRVLQAQAQTRWCQALGELASATTTVGLVCSSKTKDAFHDLFCFLAEVGSAINNGRPEAFQECTDIYGQRMEQITQAIRKEIEVDRAP